MLSPTYQPSAHFASVCPWKTCVESVYLYCLSMTAQRGQVESQRAPTFSCLSKSSSQDAGMEGCEQLIRTSQCVSGDSVHFPPPGQVVYVCVCHCVCVCVCARACVQFFFLDNRIFCPRARLQGWSLSDLLLLLSVFIKMTLCK